MLLSPAAYLQKAAYEGLLSLSQNTDLYVMCLHSSNDEIEKICVLYYDSVTKWY